MKKMTDNTDKTKLDKKEVAELDEFKRRELEDIDSKRDAKRRMAWYSLFGMLLYPFSVIFCEWIGLTNASTVIGDMAGTYYIAVSAIVVAFYSSEYLADKNK
jgi:hypothetical protein